MFGGDVDAEEGQPMDDDDANAFCIRYATRSDKAVLCYT